MDCKIKMVDWFEMIAPEIVIKRLNRIKHYILTGKREQAAAAVDEALTYFFDSRHARFHRMIMAFITYCHSHDDITKFEDYLDMLKFAVGHCSKTMTEIKGEKVMFCKMKSISFGQCGQKEFEVFAEAVKEYAKRKYDITFDDWYQYEGRAIELDNGKK